MSGTKLSSLTAAAPLSLTDLFYTVQTPGSGGTKATLSQLVTLLGSSFLGLAATAADSSKLGGTAAASYLLSATAASTYLALSGGTLTGLLTGPQLTLTGNVSAAAWTTNGLKLKGGGSTLTDTSSSGTVALAVTDKLGGNTIAASNATTFTDYASLYLDVPTAGSNVTITNPWSLYATGAARVVGLTSAGTATITPAANTNALAVTGYSLTGSNAQSLVDLAGTWNTSGRPTGIKLNVTNTASAASSRLLDIQVNGTSVFNVDTYSVNVINNLMLQSTPDSSTYTYISYDRLNLGVNAYLSWGSTTAAASSADTYVYRDAAGTLAQRNGANAQTLRVYNTYTDASNYERGVFDWTTNANVLTIGTQNAGTGSARAISFLVGGTQKLIIGSSSATFSSDFYIDTSSKFGWASKAYLYSNGDGVIILWNSAQSGFGLLKFGGTTSSFPALKQSSATLQVRLADDSANAGLSCSYVKTDSTTVSGLPSAATAGAGARAFVTDASATTFLSTVAGGGANKVPVVSDGTNWIIA